MLDLSEIMPAYIDYILRILLAGLCGFTVGFERKTRSKEAGIRTHTIVAIGSCLMMIISKYAFNDVTGNSGEKYDGARIAAQIVSGIGFLGAGMIVFSRGTLHGLTTAAGIWATAGIGMAVGAGGFTMIIVGISTTLIIVLVHLLLHLPVKLFASKGMHFLKISFVANEGNVAKVKQLFGVKKLFRMRVVKNSDGNINASVIIKIPEMEEDRDWSDIIRENDFITAMEYFEEEW